MSKKVYDLQRIRETSNGDVVLLDTLYNLHSEIDGIKFSIDYLSDRVKISLEADHLTNGELEFEFFILYRYINILMGYYPKIVSGTEFPTSELAREFDTSEKYIMTQENYINKLDNETFKKSYKKFKKMYSNISFQICYYTYTICEINDSYPEIPLVNILQSLDGLYDKFEFTKNIRTLCSKEQAKQIKELIKNIDMDNIIAKEEQKHIVKNIIDSTSRIEFVNFETKLRNLFEHIDEKYNVFELEKKQTNPKKNFESFIVKCKHTRNKFSHSTKINNCFDGAESTLYIYKIVMVIRLLIIEEIGLSSFVDVVLLNYVINKTDERLIKELEMEAK